MQTILEDKDEGDISGRASVVGAIVCAGRVSKCVEGERNGEVRVREDKI